MARVKRCLVVLLLLPLAGLGLSLVTNVLSDAVAEQIRGFLGPHSTAILVVTAVAAAILLAAVAFLDVNRASVPVRVELPATIEALDSQTAAELRLTYLRTLERRIHSQFDTAAFELDEQIEILGQVTVAIPEAVFGAAIRSHQVTGSLDNTSPAPIREILPRYSRLILYGGAGTGKTTTLQVLALRLIEDALQDPGRPIPCFVRLRNFANPDQSITDFAISQITGLMGHDDPFVRHIGSYLIQGRCVLLLDGLNEMPRAEAAEKVTLDRRLVSLDEFVRSTNTRAVLTARESGEGQHLEWTQVKLLPPEEEAIIAYARSVVSEPDRVESFLFGLEPTMKEMIRVPFFLSALLYLFRNSQANEIIALTRGQLLEYLIKSRICAVEHTTWEAHYVSLARLGAKACEQFSPDVPFTESQASEWLKEVSARSLTDVLTTGERAALLTQDAATEGQEIAFTHPLYRHTLAARYLADQLASRKVVAAQRFVAGLAESWFGTLVSQGTAKHSIMAGDWVGVIRLTADIVHGIDVLVDVLSEFLLTPSDWRMYWKLKQMYEPNFAGILAAHALAVIGTPNALDRLVQIATSSGDAHSTLYATMALLAAETVDRIPRLKLLLDSPNPTVRYYAIGGLGEALPHEVAKESLYYALKDVNDKVRFHAAEILAFRGDPAGIDILRVFLEEYDPSTALDTEAEKISEMPEGARAVLLLLRLRDPLMVAMVRRRLKGQDHKNIILGAWILYSYFFLQKTEYQGFSPPIEDRSIEILYLIRLDIEGIAPGLKTILEREAAKPPRSASLSWNQLIQYRLARIGDDIRELIGSRYMQRCFAITSTTQESMCLCQQFRWQDRRETRRASSHLRNYLAVKMT